MFDGYSSWSFGTDESVEAGGGAATGEFRGEGACDTSGFGDNYCACSSGVHDVFDADGDLFADDLFHCELFNVSLQNFPQIVGRLTG
jgi:hypothetical protein